MKSLIPSLLILLILVFALFKTGGQHIRKKQKTVNSTYLEHVRKHKTPHIREELRKLHTVAYAKNYIVNVIKYGSHQFDFKGGEMEGGFASPKDAPKIACYVLSLSGKQCKTPYSKDAAMFYTSICGGCHGNDGKGLGGAYPNLTRDPLLGIERREEFLKNLLHKGVH
ncbi:hypothetical protein [Sulfurovum sp.]|uniref:hypothetical protein n=1 Tax=Sulfurovum sp. TaxID=1969726 RepID=UPI0026004BC0|nr:hypothetical protein [Sulfurovum sp.]